MTFFSRYGVKLSLILKRNGLSFGSKQSSKYPAPVKYSEEESQPICNSELSVLMIIIRKKNVILTRVANLCLVNADLTCLALGKTGFPQNVDISL